MLRFVNGNMFDLDADVLVNTVNCVGVMGCGVALAIKQRYPEIYRRYRADCKNATIMPGGVYVYRANDDKLILQFATKDHWRQLSRLVYIQDGLDALKKILQQQPPGTVVAIPALGCGHGGLDWDTVKAMIESHLSDLDHLDIHVFQPRDSRQLGE